MAQAATENEAVITGPAAYSEEWYAMRVFDPDRDVPVIFGASEAAAACNQSRYSSALQLYLEKRGEFDKEFTEDQLDRMEVGRQMEPVILSLYERKIAEPIIRDVPMMMMRFAPWVAATPDALADKGHCSVDAKATNWRMFDASGQDVNKFGQAGTDQVPIEYLMQAQQQMAVTQAARCDFPVLSDNRLSIYTVDRNDELIVAIISAEKELSERIVNGDPPEPHWEHPGTIDALQHLHGYEAGTVADLPAEALEWWELYQQYSATIRELEADRQQYKARVLHAIGESEIGRFSGQAYEIKRTLIADSFWTDQDAREVKLKIGQVKRRGHVRLTQRKVKVAK